MTAVHTPRVAPRNWPAVLGLLLGMTGVLAYFVVVFRVAAWMPGVRNSAWVNWILVGGGLALSLLGIGRAWTPPGPARARALAGGLASANVALAAAFAWLLYGLPALPAAAGPALGAPAPDFALPDHRGRMRRLADFRGAPLLLVFYRGHW